MLHNKINRDVLLSVLPGTLHMSESSSRLIGIHPPQLGPGQKRRMVEDGHFPISLERDEEDVALRRALTEGIESLVAAGIPPSFIYCTDEAWMMAQRALAWFPDSFNLTGDFLAWRVSPGNAGFAPHRDRQPDNLAASFQEDGYPKYATIWYALSPVSSENSCLFVVNKDVDPGYLQGDHVEEDAPSPLERALCNKQAFQSISAFTGPPGSAWCFSHRTLHWGSRNLASSTAPARISMSFVASDPSFEPSYLVNTQVVPPFDIRLALVCAQLICYHDHFPANAATLKFYFETFQKHLPSFRETYMQKVYVEFASAVRALQSSDEELNDMAQVAILDSGWLFFEDDYVAEVTNDHDDASAADDNFRNQDEGDANEKAEGEDDDDAQILVSPSAPGSARRRRSVSQPSSGKKSQSRSGSKARSSSGKKLDSKKTSASAPSSGRRPKKQQKQ